MSNDFLLNVFEGIDEKESFPYILINNQEIHFVETNLDGNGAASFYPLHKLGSAVTQYGNTNFTELVESTQKDFEKMKALLACPLITDREAGRVQYYLIDIIDHIYAFNADNSTDLLLVERSFIERIEWFLGKLTGEMVSIPTTDVLQAITRVIDRIIFLKQWQASFSALTAEIDEVIKRKSSTTVADKITEAQLSGFNILKDALHEMSYVCLNFDASGVLYFTDGTGNLVQSKKNENEKKYTFSSVQPQHKQIAEAHRIESSLQIILIELMQLWQQNIRVVQCPSCNRFFLTKDCRATYCDNQECGSSKNRMRKRRNIINSDKYLSVATKNARLMYDRRQFANEKSKLSISDEEYSEWNNIYLKCYDAYVEAKKNNLSDEVIRLAGEALVEASMPIEKSTPSK